MLREAKSDSFVLLHNSTDNGVNIQHRAAKGERAGLSYFGSAGDHEDDRVVNVLDRFNLAFDVRTGVVNANDGHANYRIRRDFLEHQAAFGRVEQLCSLDSRVGWNWLRVDRDSHHERVFGLR